MPKIQDPDPEMDRRVRDEITQSLLSTLSDGAPPPQPLVDAFRDHLWRYGFRVLQAMIRDRRRIMAVDTAPVPKPSLSEDAWEALLLDPAERDSVVVDVLERSVEKCVSDVLTGRYRQDRGAAIGTYFIRGCAITFHDVVIRWANQRICRLTELSQVDWAEVFPPVNTEDERILAYDRRRDIAIIMRGLNPLQCGIITRIAKGYTHAEIAAELGMTSKRAVEAQMRRIRAHAWHLLGAGALNTVFDDDSLAPTRTWEAA